MNERKADVFETVAACFAPYPEKDWDELTSYASWARFLAMCEQQLRGRGSIEADLNEILANHEIDAMKNPPSFAEGRFCGKALYWWIANECAAD